MSKKYDDYVKDVIQNVHDKAVADQDTELKKRALSCDIVIEMFKDLRGDDYKEDLNNIVDRSNDFNFIDALESCYSNIKFYDEFSRHRFLIKGCTHSNNSDKRTRVGIRNLLNNTNINLNEYLDNYQKLGLTYYKKHMHQNLKDKINYIKNNEWITVYRGFNTKGTEEIRTSNNKNKADYYRQQEGMGFSFSMNKYIAYIFSFSFQNNLLHFHENYGASSSESELKSQAEQLEKLIGRATIGRFVIHRDNIKGVSFGRGEDEIMCDYRDAKLINYRFISDIFLKSKQIQKIKSHKVTGSAEYIRKDKDHWINKNWKTAYKVSKEQAKIFAKTKK